MGKVSRRQGNRMSVIPQQPIKRLEVGESVAVNGVCLTVDRTEGQEIQFRLLPETLQVSTLGKIEIGQTVNLERSLRLGSRLGGHLLLGHVDGVGKVTKRFSSKGSVTLEVEIPLRLTPFLVSKGPIALDGVSLTLGRMPATLIGGRIQVHLVSHTLEATTLGGIAAGGELNVEVDLIAKYLRGML